MMNDEEMHQRFARLEAEVERLTLYLHTAPDTPKAQPYDETQFPNKERDSFSRNLATIGFCLIIAILGLIAVAIVLRYRLETHRLETRPMTPIAAGPAAASDRPTDLNAPREPAQQGSPGPAAEQAPDAKRSLDNYVDRAAGKSAGGNSYSVSLNGLGEFVNSLVKAGQITAEKAADLMQELGKHAIATTGEILKETAKAIIARHLGPKPEPKAAGSAPTQQVQVNVYASEKQDMPSQPKKTATPAKPKPKPSCRAPAADTTPVSCPSDTLTHRS